MKLPLQLSSLRVKLVLVAILAQALPLAAVMASGIDAVAAGGLVFATSAMLIVMVSVWLTRNLRQLTSAAERVARGLRKLTIAECVEDQLTLDMLKDIGVDAVQGFFLERPHPDHESAKRGASVGVNSELGFS